jgi:hypothetical protein
MGGPELEVRLLIACAAAQNLATAHNTHMAHGPWGLGAGGWRWRAHAHRRVPMADDWADNAGALAGRGKKGGWE